MASESSTSASESLCGGLLTKQKSQDFAQQIKQLELEGSKLLEATYTLSGSVIPPTEGTNIKTDELTALVNTSRKTTCPSLSALTDITAEQRTIDELREHLDAQSRETERLQKSLAEPSLGAVRYSLGARSNSLSALNLPFTTSYAGDLGASGHTPLSMSGHTLSGLSSGSAYTPRYTDYNPQTHLERQMKEMQEEISGLRNRLRQALSLGEEQKQTFRSAQEELKRQLMAAIGTKDSIIEVKSRELAAQEAQMGRLQGTIDRLEQNNRLQEETLLELTRKLESGQKSQYSNETVLSQLRKMVADRERRRGKSFSDTDSFTSQNASMLLHHIERYNSEVETENEENSLRLRQMSAELETLKSSSLERHHSISRQHQDRLSELAESQDKELSLAVERSMQARSQVTTIQEQLSALRQETSQKLAERDDQIAQLKRDLESAYQNYNREREIWQQRKQALESGMDATQKEVGLLKSDNNDAIYLRAKLESKTEELQQTVSELEESAKQRRAMEDALTAERDELQAEVKATTQRLEDAQQDVRRLQNLNDASRLESNAQLQTAVAHLEREEKGKAAEQLKSLTERLTEVTERLHELTLRHEVLKAEHKNLEQRHKDLEATHQDTSRKAEASNTSKEQLTNSLQEQMAEIGRLSQEKDYYLKISDERAKEIGELRVEIDKLAVQLEERQKNFTLLKEQNDKISLLLESSSDTTRSLREERDKLSEQLSERVTTGEQLRTTHEHLGKKLKIREKHLRDLQEDNQQMAEMLAMNKEDVEQLTGEKEALYEELKDSRYEVSALKESNTDLEGRLSKSEEGLKGELQTVTEKLRATETDLKLAKKAMKTKEHVDGKAVRVAGKMQKEVTEKRGQIDSLQSKVRWLEECFENTAKEKKTLKYESEKLSTSLQKLVAQNDRLTSDLGIMTNREKDARGRMNKLEAALEKAAVKHAAAQAQIEQFEQDIARQKLKHQLEIKELVRAGKNSKPSRPHQTETPQPKVKSVPTTVQPAPTLQSLTTATTVTTPMLDQPLLQKSQQFQQTVDPMSSAVAGTELRELIQEMRSLVNSGKQNQQQASPNYYQPPPQHHYQLPPELSQLKPANVTVKPSTSSCNTCYSTATTASLDLGQNSRMYTGSLRSSGVDVRPTKLSSRGHSRPSKPKVYHPPVQREDRYTLPSPTTSPVSDLLGDSYKDAQDTVSSITGITDDFADNAVTLKSQSVKHPSDTNVLCKRLEKKLQKLSKLGSHLVEENKEIGEMMKNQDMELKKVRNAGKLLKV